MPDYIFPFPAKDLALQELRYDACYEKIPEADRARIAADAWAKGEAVAKDVFAEQSGETSFFKIAKSCGLACEKKDVDYIVGNRRYFSDYLSGQNKINLYTKSIALWAAENSLTQAQAENLILSHEYFHYLECTKIGLTSRIYQVPMVKIGGFKLGKTGIRALSEIGAHAFARTYHELCQKQEAADV